MIGEISHAKFVRERNVPRVFPVLELFENASRKISMLNEITVTAIRCTTKEIATVKKFSQKTNIINDRKFTINIPNVAL